MDIKAYYAQKRAKMTKKRARITEMAELDRIATIQGRPISARGKPIPDNLPSWRKLRDALDSVFSLFIRMRDKKINRGLCLVCGKRPITLCYHIIPRSALGTRWDAENCIGSCSACNYSELMNRRKKNDHYGMWIKRLGAEKMEELGQRSIAKIKYSRDELADMLKEYRSKLSHER